MDKSHIPLISDNFYHLYNRAIGGEKLFLSEENYYYFIERMKYHLLPVADLFSYSLIPNQFHLFLRIKPMKSLINYYEFKKRRSFNSNKDDISDFTMEQVSNWLNGYVKAFNKMYDRKGGLFIDYTRRSEALTESDMFSFLFYTHKNAVHHGLKKRIGEWAFDSYNELLSKEPTVLMRDEIIAWFGSKQLFVKFHNQAIDFKSKSLFDTL